MGGMGVALLLCSSLSTNCINWLYQILAGTSMSSTRWYSVSISTQEGNNATPNNQREWLCCFALRCKTSATTERLSLIRPAHGIVA